MPGSPSMSAVAGERSTTLMAARGFIAPRLSWRTYPARRKTPWASAPVRSASSIASATVAASASFRPQARMASRRNARRVAAGTRRMSCASVLVSTRKPSAVDPVPGSCRASFQSMNHGPMPDPMHGFARSARRRYGRRGHVNRTRRPLLAILRRRLGVVSGIRVVSGQSRDQLAADQRLQVGFESVGQRLGIDFVAVDIERKVLDVFRFLLGILDRRLGPRVQRIIFSAARLGFGHVVREGIELTFHRRVMLGEDVRQRLDCSIVGVAARHFRKLVIHIDPQLVVPLRAHGWPPLSRRVDSTPQQGATAISSGNASTHSWPVSVTTKVWPRKMPNMPSGVIGLGSAMMIMPGLSTLSISSDSVRSAEPCGLSVTMSLTYTIVNGG